MRLIIVTGFLGSGKTTLILGLGRMLARERGLSVVVIENEINASGVDGQVLERSGLAVRQITAGCVCCTLRGDLAATLTALVEEHHPDVVIIEPSGVAGPGTVAQAVGGIMPDLPPAQVVGIVDATRLPLLMDINPFLVEGLLASSSLVVLGKCDAVDAATLAKRRAELADIDARALVMPLSCIRDEDAALVLDALDALPGQGAPQVATGTHGVEAATVARRVQRSVRTAQAGDAWRSDLARLLAVIAAGLPRSGAGVAGHLKLFADAGPAGWMAGSCTALGAGTAWRGDLTRPVAQLHVTINAIVAGMRRDHLESLVDGALVR